MYINRPYKKVHATRGKAKSSSKSSGSGGHLKRVSRFKFKRGDLVRVSYNRRTFERSFDQRFSEEVFRIRQRFLRDNIPVYLLADLQGSVIFGKFYGHELVKVSKSDDSLFKVEKILKRRGKGKRKEVLVRWLGYPPKFDSWQPFSSVKAIGN